MAQVRVDEFVISAPGEATFDLTGDPKEILLVAWAGLVQPETEYSLDDFRFTILDEELWTQAGDTLLVVYTTADSGEVVPSYSRGWSSVSGALGREFSLDGVLGGTSAVTGVTGGVNGRSDGNSLTSGQLRPLIRASGEISGVAGAYGDLSSAPSAPLVGSSGGTAATSGSLSLTASGSLEAATSGSATASGSLRHVRPLRATLAGQATVAATPVSKPSISLGADSDGQATVSGIEGPAQQMSSTVRGQGAASGEVAKRQSVSMVSLPAGSGGASGLLHYVSRLRGASDGFSLTGGDVSAAASIHLVGLLAGSTFVDVNLDVISPAVLAGESSGSSIVSGTLTQRGLATYEHLRERDSEDYAGLPEKFPTYWDMTTHDPNHPHDLVGNSDGSSTVSGETGREPVEFALESDVRGNASSLGTLVVDMLLAGRSDGSTGIVVANDGEKVLEGAIAGAAVVAGYLTVWSERPLPRIPVGRPTRARYW